MAEPLVWSEKMERLFNRHVAAPILKDPRTDMSQDVLLGYPFLTIRNQVLREGLADFCEGHDHDKHGSLTPAEKSLLFAFVNMKAHFFTGLAACRAHQRSIEKLCDEPLLVIDVGCGPGTMGLAFAEAFPGQAFDYVGVDRAPPMRERAAELLAAARSGGLTPKAMRTHVANSWTEIRGHPFGTENAVLFTFSYLFASPSLKSDDLADLVAIIKKMKSHRPQKPLALVHINSPRPVANRHYHAFRKLLGFDSKEGGLNNERLEFRKKGGSLLTAVKFVHEFLWI